MIQLTWLGHACWLIRTSRHAILLDPFLTGSPVAPVSADKVEADFILVSHGHGDHVGDAAAIAPTRSAPTATQVPLVSLKSSAVRPSKSRPRFGSSGSAKRMASPGR